MKRFLLLVPALLPACQANFIPMDQQLAMGQEAYAEMLAEEQIVTSGPEYEMVQRIGKRTARASNELYPEIATQFEWEFKLVRNDQMVNAWALPGGKCAVYTGLLAVTKDEDSLAAVMGHEAAHALAEHGAKRITNQLLISGGLGLVGAYLGSRESMTATERDSLLAALGAGATVGVALPFSRGHESEADEIGLYIAAHAGYDPRAAVGLWERMAAASQGGPPEWLSTHPSEDTRIRRLQEAMPLALQYYERSPMRGAQ